MKATRRYFFAMSAAAAAVATPAIRVRSARRGEPSASLRDAVAMRKALHSGEASSRELMELAIARMLAVDPQLNAVVTPSYDRAREIAELPETRARWFGGIPTAIKDTMPQKGLRFTHGSRGYRDRVAAETGPYVEAMELAGLVSIARVAMPEFGLSPTTEPLLGGPVRNPWSLDRSAGGSSGGSAAIVAAGVVPAACATDGAGSIRIPAAACGIVGLKPSGRQKPGVPGCLSRTVRDTAAWLASVAPTPATHDLLAVAEGRDVPRLRIGLQKLPPAGGLLGADVERVFEQSTQLLARFGHEMREAPRQFDGPAAVDAFMTLYERKALEEIIEFERDSRRSATPGDIEPLTFGFARRGARSDDDRLAAARATIESIGPSYRAQFDRCDVLMMPVLTRTAARIGEFGPDADYERVRQGLIDYATYTFLENAAGVPAISLPLGFGAGGLPVGIQFSAPAGREDLLIGLAARLETELRWPDLHPPVWAA